MKEIRILLALLIFGAFLQSCTGDIEDLADPRDAIVKKFRVTETNAKDETEISYDDEISKNANDKTGIIFSNFHGADLRVKATFDSKNIIIKQQTIGDYTIKGSGTISNNLNQLNLRYTVDEEEGANPEEFTAVYAPPQVAKKIKKVVK